MRSQRHRSSITCPRAHSYQVPEPAILNSHLPEARSWVSLCCPGASLQAKGGPLQGAPPDSQRSGTLGPPASLFPSLLPPPPPTALSISAPHQRETASHELHLLSTWGRDLGRHYSLLGRSEMGQTGKGPPSSAVMGRKSQPALASSPSSSFKSCASLDMALHLSEPGSRHP